MDPKIKISMPHPPTRINVLCIGTFSPLSVPTTKDSKLDKSKVTITNFFIIFLYTIDAANSY